MYNKCIKTDRHRAFTGFELIDLGQYYGHTKPVQAAAYAGVRRLKHEIKIYKRLFFRIAAEYIP